MNSTYIQDEVQCLNIAEMIRMLIDEIVLCCKGGSVNGQVNAGAGLEFFKLLRRGAESLNDKDTKKEELPVRVCSLIQELSGFNTNVIIKEATNGVLLLEGMRHGDFCGNIDEALIFLLSVRLSCTRRFRYNGK